MAPTRTSDVGAALAPLKGGSISYTLQLILKIYARVSRMVSFLQVRRLKCYVLHLTKDINKLSQRSWYARRYNPTT
jgi:hypothetical protein